MSNNGRMPIIDTPQSNLGDDTDTAAYSETYGNYRVGYRNPPKHSRFQKGKSGNPNGSRKRRKLISLESAISDCLLENVTITKNGRSKKISKVRAVAMQLVNRAAKGEIGALKMIFQLLPPLELNRQCGNVSPEDARVRLAHIIQRVAETQCE